MFGQGADQPVAAEHEGERFDDRRLAAVIGTDENGVVRELNLPSLDAAKIIYLQKRNPHAPSPLRP
jgi:hypothetical protein